MIIVPGSVPENELPPFVPEAKTSMMYNTAANKISALHLKTAFASNSAQAAAAQASTARWKVEELYVKTAAVMPELIAIKQSAKTQAEQATAASKDTTASAKEIEAQEKQVVENSKVLAVQEVKALLLDKYHELSNWRNKVLTNPWDKSQRAFANAAKPYFQMMGHFAATTAAYNMEAGAMKSQAASDAQNAQSLAAGVEAKRESGDTVGAAQDEEMAKAMKAQSEQLAARAATLESQVTDMQHVTPEYAQAAHIAAWNAEYNSNPDGLPPPPTGVDPNFAFTPQPPALGGPAPGPAPAR